MPEESTRFAKLNAFVDAGHGHLRRVGCGSAAALWFVLWRYENAEADTARVGLGTLAEKCATDKRNVARMLDQLQEHGYLTTLEPGNRGRGMTAVYRLHGTPEKVSPEHLLAAGKGVTTTPLAPEKVSPEHGKGVVVTPLQKVQNKDILPACAGERVGEEAKKPRARNLLFDAVVDVTGADAGANASNIGGVVKALKKGQPPFTPEEVREFGRRFWELCPWAARDGRQRPEVNELKKHIGKIRSARKANRTGFVDFGSQSPAA